MWKQKKAMRCHQMEGGRTARPVLKQADESQVKEREGGGKGVKLRDLPADGRIVEADGWLVRGSRGRVQQATATLACLGLALYWTLHCLRKKDSATTPGTSSMQKISRSINNCINNCIKGHCFPVNSRHPTVRCLIGIPVMAKRKRNNAHMSTASKKQAAGTTGIRTPPYEAHSDGPTTMASVVPAEDVEITLETLQALAAHPSVIKSKSCKDLRTAVFNFSQACTTGRNALTGR